MERWPRLKREAQGRKVRALVALISGRVSIPAGTVLTVTEFRLDEVTLQAEPCSHCGVAVYIRKVRISSVELLPQE